MSYYNGMRKKVFLHEGFKFIDNVNKFVSFC